MLNMSFKEVIISLTNNFIGFFRTKNAREKFKKFLIRLREVANEFNIILIPNPLTSKYIKT